MIRLLTRRRVASAFAVLAVAGAGTLGGLYHFYPDRTADFLREQFGYDTIFQLEELVFGLQDSFNQAKYGVLGQRVEASAEAGEPVAATSYASAGGAPERQPELTHGELVVVQPPSRPSPMPLPDIQPLAVPLRDGEGAWRIDDLPRTAADVMLMAKASVRPDRGRPYSVVQALLFDQRRINLHIVGGTKHPGGDRGVVGPGIIHEADLPNLLAAWNGGFQGIHGLNSQYGADARGVLRHYRPLVNGFASVAVYQDGSIKLGEWGRDLSFSDDLVAVRQNNILLVDNCEVNPRTKEGNHTWGYVKAGDTATFITWRSAIGVTANGDLIVAAGNDLSADTLARSLWALGACYAMQLDINRPYVLTTLYYDQPDGSLVTKKHMDQMPTDTGRFTSRRPQERDFMYLTAR
ncbi:MAG: hypothetical protein EXR52_04820 [Dehalococcoidia bacterium]|nr:hypothetical protein [Dehalococcoidia bacterium]